MKISVNNPCPCGSKKKYKKCCQKYHKGAQAKDALTLMKSRYSAYVVGDAHYIMKTTHPDNPDYHDDKRIWQKEIEAFSEQTTFKGLEIESYKEGCDVAYVSFVAIFESRKLEEESKFLKIGGFMALS
jgi:SEC-C motif-containing protein